MDAALRQLGLPGVVAPFDPENPAGDWGVFDRADPSTRQDISEEISDLFGRALDEPREPRQPAPTRGFVIPQS